MGPSHTDPPGSLDGDRRPTASQSIAMSSMTNRRRNEDSWIEISSQPSSSSLSSISQLPPSRLDTGRRPRPAHIQVQPNDPPRSTSAAGSSQDEYSESSSESDPVLSSSNEDLVREDDDDRTALGMRPPEPQTVFTPPANAFSHPPSSRRLSSDTTTYFPRSNSTPSSAIRDGDRTQRPHLHREREHASTSYQADHDAALRASLTTLLSCAAAVRPKPTVDDKPPSTQRSALTRPSTQPAILQLVPESRISQPVTNAKPTKRRSRSSSKDRNSKKIRSKPPATSTASADDVLISPTIASWMISAGFVLLFSAISFSAGYAWGREVGRLEGDMGGSCGAEALRGGGGPGGPGGARSGTSGRIRWTAGNSSVTV